MPFTLRNNNIELQVDYPLEGYRQSRFDWTGKVIDLKWRGHSILSCENADRPDDPTLGRGLYNEFGMMSALGYEEAAPNGWFHKIGIGLLRKTEETYDFQKAYEIRPADFTTDIRDTQATLTCLSTAHDGYAYDLQKVITLFETGFIIEYHLKNRGQKLIKTNEYNHNFLLLDNRLESTVYALRFPFDIQSDRLDEVVNPEGVAALGRRDITLKQFASEPFFFSDLSGSEHVQAKWELDNRKTGFCISEQGDFTTHSVNLWGWKGVISPELFIDLDIPPGESRRWKRTYTITEVH